MDINIPEIDDNFPTEDDNNTDDISRNIILNNEASPQRANIILSEIFEWMESIAFSIIVVVLLFTFAFRIVVVDGDSMLNTLHTSDRIIISKMMYKPAIGDVIVFIPDLKQYENKPFVKRIIALEGQIVNIDGATGNVYVDDVLIEEKYIKSPTYKIGTQKYPLTVPAGKVFVMGDNRNESYDSRYSDVGTIDTRAILGRSIVKIFPFKEFGDLNEPWKVKK